MAGIDIIMSAYNEEKVIERAIVSILEQTYQDWRLLICNDGSKDGTLDILRKYESKYGNEKYIIFFKTLPLVSFFFIIFTLPF